MHGLGLVQEPSKVGYAQKLRRLLALLVGEGTMSDALWYYAEREETKGPVRFDELVQLLKRRTQAEEVLVWSEGFQDWARAGDVQELSRLLVRPPPLPSKRRAVSPLSTEYVKTATPEEKKLGWKGWAASLGGAVIGLGLSKAMGAAFWVPAICVLVAHWGIKKMNPAAPIAMMLSVLVGHTAWVAVGHVTLLAMNRPSPDLGAFFIDLFAASILTVWALKRESVSALYAVFAYQCIALVSTLIFIDHKG